MGNGCYHITDRNPEVREPALRLFRRSACADWPTPSSSATTATAQLKLIECNARFTAANCLVDRSGLDLASFVYNRLAGLPQPPQKPYRTGLRLWYPTQDFRAFLELRRRKQLTFGAGCAASPTARRSPISAGAIPCRASCRFLRSLKSGRAVLSGCGACCAAERSPNFSQDGTRS